MTPDDEFYLLVGGICVPMGALIVGAVLCLLSRRSDPFRQMKNDEED